MAKPCIICVAITGSVPTKANNPAVPITVSEQIESTQEAFETERQSRIAMYAMPTRPRPRTQTNSPV